MNLPENQFPDIQTIRQYSRQYSYTVRGTETGTSDELGPAALLSMLQEAASIDAERSGLGAATLDPEGFCWVLMRTSVRLSALPRWQDDVIVDTWTNGAERIFSIRDFLLSDPAGRLFGRATSSWLVVDKEAHRPQKLSVLNNPRIKETTVSALCRFSPKLTESCAALPEQPILSRVAGYSEIDRNGHVNNTRYASWCMDAVGMNGFPAANLVGFDINYISEVKCGETVGLYFAKIPAEQGFYPEAKDACLIVGRHEDDRRTAFITILYWDAPL